MKAHLSCLPAQVLRQRIQSQHKKGYLNAHLDTKEALVLPETAFTDAKPLSFDYS